MDQLYAQLSTLTKDHKTLEDESTQVHVKMSHERTVHTQVSALVSASSSVQYNSLCSPNSNSKLLS